MRIPLSQTASLAILVLSFLGLFIAPLEASEATRNPRIIFLGDSITAGFGLERSEAYPAVIAELAQEKKLEWNVVNAGLSGDTTNGGVRRVKLLTKKPFDLIVVALGGNDGLRGIEPAVTKKNLLTIIDTARKAQPNVPLLLVGIDVPENMGENYTQKFLNSFEAVAKERKIAFSKNLLEGIAGDSQYNQEDMIHPNAEGQRVIATRLFKRIETIFSESR